MKQYFDAWLLHYNTERLYHPHHQALQQFCSPRRLTIQIMSKPLSQADIGLRIRQARERIGITQKDFAQAVGKDQKAISEYEHGTRRVSAIELAGFASVLGLPIRYFYEGEFETEELDQLLLHEFRALPSIEHKRDALALIRILLQSVKRNLA